MGLFLTSACAPGQITSSFVLPMLATHPRTSAAGNEGREHADGPQALNHGLEVIVSQALRPGHRAGSLSWAAPTAPACTFSRGARRGGQLGHSPHAGSEVPVANVGVIATGQECGRGFIHDIQHPSSWGEVTAQMHHELPPGERAEGKRMSSHPTLAPTPQSLRRCGSPLGAKIRLPS